MRRERGGARPATRIRPADTANLTFGLSLPEAALGFLAPEIVRVFFIANNDDIAAPVFETWNLGAGDVIVQYNKPMFFEPLAGYRCHKLHFHYPHHRTCWGFTDDGTPQLNYLAQECCSLTFAVAHTVPSRLEPYFKSLQGRARHMAIEPDRHLAPHGYPSGKFPSSGFISVSYFRFLSSIRSRRNCSRLELVMIGFTGDYKPGAGWWGHDFVFEQQVYATWLDLRRLTADGAPIALR